MTPDTASLWRGPRWALSLLLACLGTLGPFAIDTYLPAFAGIAADLGTAPLHMQQTLSAYLVGFALMNLFHGALSDSLGRRPIVLAGVAVFTVASAGCALSTSIGMLIGFRALQGAATGAGMVVSRAVIRDLFPPADAQRVMAQVTLFFGIAPAIAPLVGGWLFAQLGWRAVFWFLAAVGTALWIANARLLPETLSPAHVQAFNVRNLLRGYAQLLSDRRFLLLAVASGVPFNGMFLYVLSAPVYLGEILGLAPTAFFWFFILNIAGIMGGAALSGRKAGRWSAQRQIRLGFTIMLGISALNVAANLLWTAHVSWAMLPIAVFSFGWALNVPAVTLLLLDLHPERRGMAASLQASVGAAANALVAGVISPLVMHSAPALAVASAAMLLLGLGCWLMVKARLMHAPQNQ